MCHYIIGRDYLWITLGVQWTGTVDVMAVMMVMGGNYGINKRQMMGKAIQELCLVYTGEENDKLRQSLRKVEVRFTRVAETLYRTLKLLFN